MLLRVLCCPAFVSLVAKYLGLVVCRALWVMPANLMMHLASSGSQFCFLSAGEMWSELLVPMMSLAVALKVALIGARCDLGVSVMMALP